MHLRADLENGVEDTSPICSFRRVLGLGAAGITFFLVFNSLTGLAQSAFLALFISAVLIAHGVSTCTRDKGYELHYRLVSMLTAPSVRVLAVTAIVATDVMFYSFCLPFLPDLFDSWGKSNSEIAFLASTFSYSSLATGICLLVFQSVQGKENSDRDCWRALAVAACIMVVISFSQMASPSYVVFFTSRCLQGLISQFCWSYALALGMRLPTFLGASCVAWISSGESVGELVGPWFGSVLYRIGGVRCPFGVACAIMFVNTCLLSLLAMTRDVWANASTKDVEDVSADKGIAEQKAMGFSVLRLPRVTRLCMLLILACAMARGALDVLTPIHLDDVFDVSPVGIGQIFGFGTICYLFGSLAGGRLLTSAVPLQTRARAMCAAHVCMSVAMIFVFQASSSYAVAAYVAIYLSSSALVNVSVNTQLEEIGAQHGGTESLATLCVLSWSVGFALSGLVTQVAAHSAEARSAAMTFIGVANLVWLVLNSFLDRELLCGSPSARSKGDAIAMTQIPPPAG